jgi:signal transduction histidine kinase
MMIYAGEKRAHQLPLETSSTPKSILIVDDNAVNRTLLRQILQAGNYATIEAEDGIEALSVLEREPIAVIVSDILMPNMDGYCLCRAVRLRPELKDLVFILYTATNFTRNDEKFGMECGADRFVNKQGTPKVILRMIDEVINERRAHRPEYFGRTNASTSEMEMKKYNAIMIRQLEENSIEIGEARDELRILNEKLEKRVSQRTAQLEIANQRLKALNNELERRVAIRTNELADKNASLELRTKELARSNADLEQFASAASHDLQEPLRAVAGCIQVFERKYRGRFDDKGDDLIRMIVGGSARMKALIDGILAYSRAGRGENFEVIDTGAALQQALADLTVAIAESKSEVVFGQLPTLRFIKTQFQQVLRNLVGNAIKYRSALGQKIYVAAERKNGFWIFSVADNGIGFEQQYAEKVFGIFQRLHARDQYMGTGMGLAISKKIVECWGGKMWVESAPDRGSTFFFSVPETGVPSPK